MTPNDSSSHLPGLSRFRQAISNEELESEDVVQVLIALLRKRQISGPKECAEATALLYRRLIASSNFENFDQLLAEIQHVSPRLIAAQPGQLAIDNIGRRVLGLVREELERDRLQCIESHPIETRSDQARQGGPAESSSVTSSTQHGISSASLFRFLSKDHKRQPPERTVAFGIHTSPSNAGSPHVRSLCEEVVEGIQELLDELRQVEDQIAAYSLDQIHSHEIILTNVLSKELSKFLVKAAGKRKFEVIVASDFLHDAHLLSEEILGSAGHHTGIAQSSKRLVGAGVPVTMAPQSAIFSLMPRISKVLLTAQTVFSDGSALCKSGTKMLAMTARFHRTPVLTLTGVYQMSPKFPFDCQRLPSSNGTGINLAEHFQFDDQDIHVRDLQDDVLPAELVDLYISNVGPYSPLSLHRVISDHYRTEELITS